MRAIRQIVVLGYELRGLFKAPDRDAPRKQRLVKSDRTRSEPPDFESLFSDLHDRDDLNDLDDLGLRGDYRTGRLDEVVAGIRKTLGAEAPADDPFAPSAQRKPPQTAHTNRASMVPPSRPEPLSPTPNTQAPAKPPMPQAKPALKAAMLAASALAGKGFRKPPSKPRGPGQPHNRRRNRGPPR